MQKKEITIYDIAEKLGISPSTVSRALNGHSRISKERIKKIEKVAHDLGYQPNKFAANLRSGKTHTIGVIVPKINRYFHSENISGIEQWADKHGYSTIICQSYDSLETEKRVVKTLFDNRIDGLLISVTINKSDFKHLQPYREKNIPVVFFDRVPADQDNVCVVSENEEGAELATQHLIDKGCKKIVHITHNKCVYLFEERRNGFLNTLQKNGFPTDKSLIYHCELSRESAYKLMPKILEKTPDVDGFFCATDNTAIGVLQYLKDHGIKVPQQMKVIGFNNDPSSTIIEPSLSTIEHKGRVMGEEAAQQLISLINNEATETKPTKIKTRLVERDSTKSV